MSSATSASAAPESGNDIWSRVLQSRKKSCEALGNDVLQQLLQQGGWDYVRDEAPPDLHPLAQLEWLLRFYFSASVDETSSSQQRRQNFRVLNGLLAKVDKAIADQNAARDIRFDEVPNPDEGTRRPSATRWGPLVANRSPSLAPMHATASSTNNNRNNGPTPMSIDEYPEARVVNSNNAREIATNSSLEIRTASLNPKEASSSRLSPHDNIQNQRSSSATATSKQPPGPSNGTSSQYANQSHPPTATLARNNQVPSQFHHSSSQQGKESSRPVPGGNATAQRTVYENGRSKPAPPSTTLGQSSQKSNASHAGAVSQSLPSAQQSQPPMTKLTAALTNGRTTPQADSKNGLPNSNTAGSQADASKAANNHRSTSSGSATSTSSAPSTQVPSTTSTNAGTTNAGTTPHGNKERIPTLSTTNAGATPHGNKERSPHFSRPVVGDIDSRFEPPLPSSQGPKKQRNNSTNNAPNSDTPVPSVTTAEGAPRSAQPSQQPPAKLNTALINGRTTSENPPRKNPNPYTSSSGRSQNALRNTQPSQQQPSLDGTVNQGSEKNSAAHLTGRVEANHAAPSATLTERPSARNSGSVSTAPARMEFTPGPGAPIAVAVSRDASSVRRAQPEAGSNDHRSTAGDRTLIPQSSHASSHHSQNRTFMSSSTASDYVDQWNDTSNTRNANGDTRDTDVSRRPSYEAPVRPGAIERASSARENGHKDSHGHRRENGSSTSAHQKSQPLHSNHYSSQRRESSGGNSHTSAQSHHSGERERSRSHHSGDRERSRSSSHPRDVTAHHSRSRSPTPITSSRGDSMNAHANVSSHRRDGTAGRERSRSPTPNYTALDETRSSASHGHERGTHHGSHYHGGTSSSASSANYYGSHPPYRRSSNASVQSLPRSNDHVDARAPSSAAATGHNNNHTSADFPREVTNAKQTMRNGQAKHGQKPSKGASATPLPLGIRTMKFPAEFDRSKAIAIYGGIHPRHETTVTFAPFTAAQHHIDQCLQRLAEWEPFWKVKTVNTIGQTWKVDKVDRSNKDDSDAPTTAAELVWALSQSEADQIQDWGVVREQRVHNQGDARLLLFMLPAKVDMKKRADAHLWPKGTFLTLDGVPIRLNQRKQQSHDHKAWYGMSDVLDLTQHINRPVANHKIQLCCVEQEQYFYCLAICQHVTPANLFVGETLVSLSREEATRRALEFAKPMICLDDDDQGGSNESAGKLVFSLLCPISKVVMKKPVRGDICSHFQCFDLLTFLESNVRTSGGRWRCASCEKFISWRKLRFCGLTAALLNEFQGETSTVRDRVEFQANGKYRLLEETKARYNKKRKVPADTVGSSSNKRQAISTVQDAIEIDDD